MSAETQAVLEAHIDLTNAEAAAAQILDNLTPTELTTLEAAWHATGDVQTAMQETLTHRKATSGARD